MAERGSRPRAVKQQFEYAYLFGSVCINNGASQALVMPYVNREIMITHLQQISDSTPVDRHAVIIMDGAGWYSNDIDNGFNNLTIIKLPPYSPELNPIEQVWSWLRQHRLANRCFTGYDSIVDAVSNAWHYFVSDAKRVMNMCTRDWMILNS
jgi:transposase